MSDIKTLQDIDPELFADHVSAQPASEAQSTGSAQPGSVKNLQDIDPSLFGGSQTPEAAKKAEKPSLFQNVNNFLSKNIPETVGATAGALVGAKTGLNVPTPKGYDAANLNLQLAGQTQARRHEMLQQAMQTHGAVIDAAELEHQAHLTALEDASERLRNLREQARAANLPIEPPASEIPREGKTGVQNYGEKFGLSAADAAKAEDMTKTSEKGVWALKKQIAEAESKIGPNYSLNQERGLMLPKGMEAYTPEQTELVKNLRAAEAEHAALVKEVAAAQSKYSGLLGSNPQAVRQATQKLSAAEEASAKAADKLALLESKYPGYSKAMNALAPYAKAGLGALSGMDVVRAYQEAAQKQPNLPAAVVHGLGGVGGLMALYSPEPRTKIIGGALTLPALTWDAAEYITNKFPYRKSP